MTIKKKSGDSPPILNDIPAKSIIIKEIVVFFLLEMTVLNILFKSPYINSYNRAPPKKDKKEESTITILMEPTCEAHPEKNITNIDSR